GSASTSAVTGSCGDVSSSRRSGTSGYRAPVTSDRLYFKQLLPGDGFAHRDMLAQQMVNFVYLIGDREKGEAVVVDPAYAVDELIEILDNDGMRLTGVL